MLGRTVVVLTARQIMKCDVVIDRSQLISLVGSYLIPEHPPLFSCQRSTSLVGYYPEYPSVSPGSFISCLGSLLILSTILFSLWRLITLLELYLDFPFHSHSAVDLTCEVLSTPLILFWPLFWSSPESLLTPSCWEVDLSCGVLYWPRCPFPHEGSGLLSCWWIF